MGDSLDIVVGGYLVEKGKLLLVHHRKLDKWLPFGGHIEENETPDDALRREAKEELGVEISFFQHYRENINESAKPFYINTHPITETHFHYCLFYLCGINQGEILINERELKDYRWFRKQELENVKPPLDEGHIITCLEAIELARRELFR